MNQERLLNIIQGSVISEKGNHLDDSRNLLVFKVLKSATKKEIKAAVELLLEVNVVAVNTVTIKGKRKRVRGKQSLFTHRSDIKKAYITLAEGQNIDLEATAAKSAE